MKLDTLLNVLTVATWASNLIYWRKKMEIVNKDLGKYANIDVALKEGALVAEVKVPILALVREAAKALEAKIPGSIDDVVIEAVLAELEILLNK